MNELFRPDEMPPPPRFPDRASIVRAADLDRRANCRWTMRRSWGPGPSILFCGQNPSRADAERDDPTTIRNIGFAFRWGFGSLVMVNIEPFITPKPAELARWRSSAGSSPLSEQNALRVVAELKRVDLAVAAWGNFPEEHVSMFLWRLEHGVMGSASGLGRPVGWRCFGVNSNGSPKHTLARGKNRVPDSAQHQEWKVPEHYFEESH